MYDYAAPVALCQPPSKGGTARGNDYFRVLSRNFFLPYRMMSSLGALVRSLQPSSVSNITSSMRTPSFPGR